MINKLYDTYQRRFGGGRGWSKNGQSRKRHGSSRGKQPPAQAASDIGHEILNRHFGCRERFACFLLGGSS